ncbi:MAG TPA: maltose alpha-D-glucosyltransferase, partial [Thermomicrobiales bacterium]|nr:maltose alpha-D-glucosyltransferase [Thermomicrobiales bacterium]
MKDVGEPGSAAGTTWYKDAVFYEVHVRAFADSNGDGIGDFQGLIGKLDYLRDLGITAIWLLPFFPSPLRDDGYDISDYTAVHPAYGNIGDFQRFLNEAHQRDLKVIIELVLNHTSEQHPWFQRARRAPKGSCERNFYVWSDTPERYKQARVIFQDYEQSNWSWDPVADAYYWHRFYSHQPDLNYDHPPVREAIFNSVDFWLEMGVDGLRLDAVPYLVERERTSSENLPGTHQVLKMLRNHIDTRFVGRMLLAEANQWPEDAVAYFGDGDECHMAFHFPLMPRLFMALRTEDRLPVVDIMQQTPPIPDSCQWAIFLRNHDELTLEMVTEEERLYMYRAFAPAEESRINLGIRRRLAPLLGNSRRRMELMNALICSLPGTPVIYYGDEIGMGDNIYLGDRDGVRTPMQWSADRNAGFSAAPQQRLYNPLIVDYEYHHETVHVEAQEQNPHSLLGFMKRLLALRKRHHAFGRGSLQLLQPMNHRVLAFMREHEEESILIVANLSRFSQAVELDLGAYKGRAPIEVFGRSQFWPVGAEPYRLTLGPHAFYWFDLSRPPASNAVRLGARNAVAEGQALPIITTQGAWGSVVA